ncbi:MAG: hypothetical protein ACLTSX_04815 [Collinsella sp.]
MRLNREQVLALEYDKGQRVFEDEVIEDSSLDDVDHEVLDRYKEILGTDAPDEQVLRSRRFMRDGRLTVAGALLFAQDPSRDDAAGPGPCPALRRHQDGDGRAPQHRQRSEASAGRCHQVIQGAYMSSSRACSASSSSWGPTGNSKLCPSTRSSPGSRGSSTR